MPFAQQHWPFENEEAFDKTLFPADFICEGIDQTRGWFYSLMAISTFVRGTAPYRNVLVNDLILDRDGIKMSKTKGNTVDPFEQFDRYGADATRWYLLYASPAWSPTKYDEKGLQEIAGKFFGTLRNIYHFFVLYANQDGVDPRSYSSDRGSRPELDRWILSRYNNLIKGCIADMDSYDHMKAVRRIQDFTVEDFSNWYIRRARRRFWGDALTEDKKAVYATTLEILVGISQLMAPFAPFISDEIYTNLADGESVHLSFYPEPEEYLINADLEEKMDLVRDLVSLGRGVREKERLKVRQPLPAILIDGRYKAQIGDMEELIKEELNIKSVIFRDDLGDYMNYSLKPDFKVAGPKLGSRMKDFAASLSGADAPALIEALSGKTSVLYDLAVGSVIGSGAVSDIPAEALGGDVIEIEQGFIDVQVSAKEGFAIAMEGGLFTILDTGLTPELISEGLAREFVSKVQQLRKQSGLEMMDRIKVCYQGDADVVAAVDAHRDYIMREVLADALDGSVVTQDAVDATKAADALDGRLVAESGGTAENLLAGTRGWILKSPSAENVYRPASATGDAYDLNGHPTAIAITKRD
jgi:isoleucyl-tRNA synthetase